MRKFVCIYKNKPTESFYDDDDMFVALDTYSGGYPTRTKITRVHQFKTLSEAKKYASMFDDEIFASEVEIIVKLVD